MSSSADAAKAMIDSIVISLLQLLACTHIDNCEQEKGGSHTNKDHIEHCFSCKFAASTQSRVALWTSVNLFSRNSRSLRLRRNVRQTINWAMQTELNNFRSFNIVAVVCCRLCRTRITMFLAFVRATRRDQALRYSVLSSGRLVVPSERKVDWTGYACTRLKVTKNFVRMV